jgi:sugar phosphate isomerase/epimerase
LALRLDAEGVHALADDLLRLSALRARLVRHDLVPFTANGFVLGRFHGAGVKDAVYRPTWREAEREEYTVALAGVLAALRGPGEVVSISTAPGSWRGWGEDPREVARGCAQRLVRTARRLRALEHATGTRVLLGLEPEPRCTLESTAEALAFFRGPLADAFGTDLAARHHLGVCFDVCHQAVAFEDTAASLEALRAARVPIVKVQASCALETPDAREAAGRAALEAFVEPTWLHQTSVKDARGRLHMEEDLPQALASRAPAWRAGRPWRTHFHGPVFRAQAVPPLRTTQAELDRALARLARGDLTGHLEIETYTWEALPEAERQAGSGFDLVEALAREYEHVLGVLAQHGVTRAEPATADSPAASALER